MKKEKNGSEIVMERATLVRKPYQKMRINACKREHCGGSLVYYKDRFGSWWSCINCARTSEVIRYASGQMEEHMQEIIADARKLFAGE